MSRTGQAVLAVALGALALGCGRTDPFPGLQCPDPQVACGEECRNLLADPLNCGGCGVRCTSDQTCTGGVCKPICPADRQLCGSACVDLATDFNNCGQCGRACSSTQTCSRGQCAAAGCPSGFTLCAGQCVNLKNDRQNCGRCGQPCDQYLCYYCVDGFCSQTSGVFACQVTACTDTGTDPKNCGSCGNACQTSQVCDYDPARGYQGSCLPQCEPGHTSCNGSCTDLLTDARNCGRCGNACPACQVCSAGQCTAGAGVLRCGQSCDSLQLRPGQGVCSACSTACDASGLACQRCLY